MDVTTRQLASILALQLPRAASPLPRWKRQAYADPLVVGGVPAEIATLTEEELRRLIAHHPDLRRLAHAPEPDGTAMRDRLAAVLQLEPDATGRLRSLFAPLPKGILRAAEHGRRRRWRVGLAGHGALLAVILAVVIAPPLLGFHYAADERWAWARIFGVVVYAAFPAFLFARFVRYRADSLWTDFVLNLHRLDMDSPQHLPEPLMNSVYYEPWLEHGGARYANTRSIYEYKFESVYGVGSTCAHHARMLRVVEVLPVYLFTLLLAVCWTFVLSGSAPMTAPARYLTTEQAVSLGFLGAYAFSVQALIRRYFQSDLRPAAFTGLIQRFLFVLIGAYAVHEAVGARLDAHTEVALLFLVGFFPTTVVQILRILTAKVLRGVGVPNMNSDFPLSELDGMTIWVETRLLEIGVEDMQNLSTANLTDVLLQSRVPVARLVDWIDQSILYLHLPSAKAQQQGDAGRNTLPGMRHVLRVYGIRAATDLQDTLAAGHEEAAVAALGRDVSAAARLAPGSAPEVVRILATTLRNEPNLLHVRAWKEGEKTPVTAVEAHPGDATPNGQPPTASLWVDIAHTRSNVRSVRILRAARRARDGKGTPTGLGARALRHRAIGRGPTAGHSETAR